MGVNAKITLKTKTLDGIIDELRKRHVDRIAHLERGAWQHKTQRDRRDHATRVGWHKNELHFLDSLEIELEGFGKSTDPFSREPDPVVS